MIRLVIFDLDGTIVNTLESLAYTANRVMERMGLAQMPSENFRMYAGNGGRKMVSRCLNDAGDSGASRIDEAMKLYAEEFEEGCIYKVKAYPGMEDTLDDLREYGVQLAVCTNKAQKYAQKVTDAVYGHNYFNYVLGDGNGHALKPDPEGLLHIAESLGVTPEECVYVGDSDVDMITGKAAGMYTVGAAWGFRPKSELAACEPDQIIEHPEELLNIQL